MTLFVLLIIVLIIAAYFIVLPPLWKVRDIEDAQFDQRNILIARHRLAELKEQLQFGALSQSLYDEQLVELKQALGDDLEITHPVNTSPTQGRWVAYLLIIAIPVLAGSLYWLLGNPQSIDRVDDVTEVATGVPDSSAINKMVEGLAEKMKTDPNDANSWFDAGTLL